MVHVTLNGNTNGNTNFRAGGSLLLTFADLRIASEEQSLAQRSDLMNLTPGTTGFEHPVGSKLWQH